MIRAVNVSAYFVFINAANSFVPGYKIRPIRISYTLLSMIASNAATACLSFLAFINPLTNLPFWPRLVPTVAIRR